MDGINIFFFLTPIYKWEFSLASVLSLSLINFNCYWLIVDAPCNKRNCVNDGMYFLTNGPVFTHDPAEGPRAPVYMYL